MHSALNVGLARIVRVPFRPKGFQGRHAVARPVRLSIGDVSRSLRPGIGCRSATPAGHSWAAWRVRVELSVPDPPDPARRWAGRSPRNAASRKILVAYTRAAVERTS